MAKSIEVTLKLNDRDFIQGIRRANRELDKLQRNLKTSGGGARQLSGQQGLGGLTTAVAAFGAASVATTKGTDALFKSNKFLVDTTRNLAQDFDDVRNSLKGGLVETVEGVKQNKKLYDIQRNLNRVTGELSDEFGNLEAQSRKVNGGFGKNATRLVSFAAIAALVATAVGGIVASFRGLSSALAISAEFEQIEITLGNLTGSAEKGARALEVITEKAQELPFAFDEIAGAAPSLLTVSDNLQEFQDNIQLAADIAANFKIPFEQAVSSLQRAFSAGAAAADVFREKGVLSAAGFQAGVTYSVDETIAKFREFGVSIEGVSSKLNVSLTGAISQTGDAFTLFRKEVGDAIRPTLTVFLTQLVALFRANKTEIDAFAKSIGEGVVRGFIAVGRAGAVILDVFQFIFGIVGRLNNVLVENFGPGLLEVAASVYIVVKAMNAFKVAQMAAAQAAIFLQGVTGVGLIKVGAGIAAAAGTALLLNEAFEKAAEGFSSLGEEGADSNSNLARFNSLVADIQAGVAALPEDTKAAGGELKDLLSAIAQGAKNAGDEVKNTLTPLQQFKEDLDKITDVSGEEYKAFLLRLEELYKTGAMGIDEYRSLLRQLDEAFGENEGLNNFLDTLGTAQKSLSEDLANAFIDGKDAMESFKNFFKTIITQIIADIIRLQIIQPILGAILSPFGYGFGTGGNVVKLPGKAKGGPVLAGGTYLVGEEGPELLQMGSQSGNIIPNNRIGGMGGSTNITYNINAVDAPSFQQLVARDPEFIYNVSRMGARRTPGG